MKNEWFASWFDTAYYHTLYQDRDENEARAFIEKLVNDLKIPKSARVLDLACGKGRHSLTLCELGYNVIGVDLSENSIKTASEFSTENLSFAVHDMRNIIEKKTFSAVFNLFTSFGYFDDEKDSLRVLNSVNSMLEEDGILVIDFMNALRVVRNLVENEIKNVDGIDFNIQRKYDGQHIYKEIEFTDNGKNFHFTERVQALTIDVFEKLLSQSGFRILRTFGNFDLSPFDKIMSDRLIIIAQKV
jgi:SAM-dependent methyltransferase